MRITFFSNFLNHHQLPFCLEMLKIIGDSYKFVATEKIPEERIKLGYEDMNEKYDFVIRSYENMDEAMKLADESDVVIIGSAPQKMILNRLRCGKLTFRYSERIYKNKFDLKMWALVIKNITFKERKNVYLLCASAYSAYDYNKSFAFVGKTYKWGYFPEIKEYDIKKIINKKENKSILWVGRFLSWKHPELVVELAKKLRNNNYCFNIKMIGTGEEKNRIEIMIKENNLDTNIKLLDSMSPEKVRNYMEESSIFLFTSDRGEGWGAVLNESMNSGCAVVASHEIGSVPFMIKDNENGMIYEDGNNEDLYNKVSFLLDNSYECQRLGTNAYNTMIKLWNPKISARRLVNLSKKLLNNNSVDAYKDGPCSFAGKLKDNWYK